MDLLKTSHAKPTSSFFEKVSNWMDERDAMSTVYLDFNKAFALVPLDTLITKLQKWGLEHYYKVGYIIDSITARKGGRQSRDAPYSLTQGCPTGSSQAPTSLNSAHFSYSSGSRGLWASPPSSGFWFLLLLLQRRARGQDCAEKGQAVGAVCGGGGCQAVHTVYSAKEGDSCQFCMLHVGCLYDLHG